MANQFLKQPHHALTSLHHSSSCPAEWLLSGKFDSLNSYAKYFDLTEFSLSYEFRSCECDYCKSLPSYDFDAVCLADAISYRW